MSAAAPTAVPAEAIAAVPVKAGKKKLVVIATALAVLLSAGGAGGWFVLKKRAAAAAAAAAAEEDGDAHGDAHAAKATRASLKSAPTFVALDPFTVNLADREAERYVQVGMTLELADAKAGDLLKAYMPAIRNNILLVLASKTAGQLMEHDGKLLLAAQVRAAAVKPLGYMLVVPADAAAAATDPPVPEGDDPPPIRAVHFSNFIIQ